MPCSPLKRIVLTLLAGSCLQGALAIAATPPAAPPPAKKPDPTWAFSLLPKSFQSHPLLAMSVITEMTDEGRKLTPPTPKNPAYYYVYSTGFHEEGSAGAENAAKVSEDNLREHVQLSLATAGYIPGSKEHAPSLFLVFVWGVHNKLEKDDIENDRPGTLDVRHHNLLSRAAVVGGAAFAKELTKVLEEQDRTGAAMSPLLDPVYRFTQRDVLTRNLMEQILDDCYYVVISAYDAAAAAHGERKLLWRTKISTPAQGVSLAETTPALLDCGTSYFGQDMKQPSIVGKRISREHGGRVELAPLEIKGYGDKQTEPEPPPAKK